jgi:hypothetical protein
VLTKVKCAVVRLRALVARPSARIITNRPIGIGRCVAFLHYIWFTLSRLADAISSSIKPSSSSTSTTRSKLATKAAAAADSSHKVTEYFPIRRSERKPKKALEKQQLQDVECHLLEDCDEHLDLDVVQFPEKGRGVIVTRDYDKGEFVVEYAGDLIDVGSAKERESKYSLDLTTGCYMYYFKHSNKQFWCVVKLQFLPFPPIFKCIFSIAALTPLANLGVSAAWSTTPGQTRTCRPRWST